MSHTARARLEHLVTRGFSRAASSGEGFALSDLLGRTTEISCEPGRGSSLTFAVALVAAAQRDREPAAWIRTGDGTFFPPDAAAAGVELSALVVVRVDGARAGGRAADK